MTQTQLMTAIFYCTEGHYAYDVKTGRHLPCHERVEVKGADREDTEKRARALGWDVGRAYNACPLCVVRRQAREVRHG